jgi:hypothetical protein
MKNKYPAVLEEVGQLKELLRKLCDSPNTEALEILTKLRTVENPLTVLQQIPIAASSNPLNADASLRDLNRAAFNASTFTVPAQPWTAVAGDGIVSHLICSWARRDSIFIHPFVDIKCFLQDMRSQNVTTSKYCSPFLVNIICANRAVGSRHPSPLPCEDSEADPFRRSKMNMQKRSTEDSA